MKKALLLIDLQNDYFEGGSNPLVGSLDAVLKTQKLLQYFRLNSLPVIHIQHISIRKDATFFLPETVGAEIHQCVSPEEYESIVIKHYPNSFYQTNLNQLLLSQGITDLVVCGMMTHMCVDATVRAAKDLGYNCTIMQDACATKSLEFNGLMIEAWQIQASFLAALVPFYATIVSVDEYINSCLVAFESSTPSACKI